MFTKIQNLFSKSDDGEVPSKEYSLQLASAILLLEIAKADYVNDPKEEASIKSSLKQQFSLSDEDIEALFEEAAKTGEDAVSLHAYVRLVNQECSDAEKVILVEQMWKVAFADGELDKYEDYNIRKISELLYVPHHAFIKAKQKVINE